MREGVRKGQVEISQPWWCLDFILPCKAPKSLSTFLPCKVPAPASNLCNSHPTLMLPCSCHHLILPPASHHLVSIHFSPTTSFLMQQYSQLTLNSFSFCLLPYSQQGSCLSATWPRGRFVSSFLSNSSSLILVHQFESLRPLIGHYNPIASEPKRGRLLNTLPVVWLIMAFGWIFHTPGMLGLA